MQFLNIVPFVSFFILATLLTGRIFYLRKKGIKVTSDGGRTSANTRFVYPVFGLIFLLWLFEIIKPAVQTNFSVLPDTFTGILFEFFFLKVTGLIFIAASLILLFITLLHFKTSLRFGLNENHPGKLITAGIFSVSRNPFFLSLDLYFIGTAFILPNLFFIGFAVLATISIHIFILKEEQFLLNVYKEEYRKYRENVRRYI